MQRWRRRYPDYALEVQYYDDAGQLERITAGTVDLGYIRFRAGEDPTDQEIVHRVLLYQEEPVVCAAADHWIAAAEDSVTSQELADETILEPQQMLREYSQNDTRAHGSQLDGGAQLPGTEAADDIHRANSGAGLARAERMALEVAASGAGVVVLPSSVARMLSRRDLVIRTVTGAPSYQTGLAWRRDRDNELIQEFIGIARGRRAGSGRSQLASERTKPEAAPAANARRQRRPQPRSPRARPPRGRPRPG